MDARKVSLGMATLLVVVALVLGLGQALAQKAAVQTQEPAKAAAQTPEQAKAVEAPPAAEAPAATEDADGAGSTTLGARENRAATSGMRRITNADREAAAARAAARAAAAARTGAGGRDVVRRGTPQAAGASQQNATNVSTPHYFTEANWAFSPIIRKFQDTLAGLGPANHSSIGADNYIPVAVPIKTAGCTVAPGNDCSPYSGSDYYEIALNDYFQKMHSSFDPTKLRGYRDLNPAAPDTRNHYLGPVIVAARDRPVRVLFKNQLTPGASGRLFIPMDDTIMGAGLGPLRGLYPTEEFPESRATLHLHGGNTPWISDGTPHQWITPVGELAKNVNGFTTTFGPGATHYKRGVSNRNVPDMVGPGKSVPCATTPCAADLTQAADPGDGLGTFYWTNQQSGRLMFYHDHAYGTTRLNVYAGSAAGYLVYDPFEETLITSGVLPNQAGIDANGTAIVPLTGGVYRWGIPLIIQDKTFVDPTTIAATDPTWLAGPWGSTPGTPVKGDLWFSHVYMPNQNPFDEGGANPFGRWDYGPWFWPPMIGNAAPTYGAVDNPYYISAAATPNEPPTIPGTPNPSLTPESFMDTPLVNGVAYPTVTLPPAAYRFRILNASNDRSYNLQLYYAVDPASFASATFTNTGVLSSPATGVCKGAGSAAVCTEVGMVPAVPHLSGKAMTPSPSQLNLPLCPSGVTSPIPTAATPGGIDLTSGTPNAFGSCWPETWPSDGRAGGVPDPLTVGPPIIQLGTEGGWLYKPAIVDNQPVNYNYNRRDIVVLNVQNRSLNLGPAERADIIVDFSSVPTGSTLILYNDAGAPVPAFDTRLDFYTDDPDQTSTGGAPTTLAGFGPNTRTIMQINIAGTAGSAYSAQVDSLFAQMPANYGPGGQQPPPIVPEVAYGAANNTYSRIQDTQLTVNGAPMPMVSKAIQELFTVDYGRMNATMGVELPLTNFLTQTTIPLGYIDPPTEIVVDGQPQLWKITHNGVDTHAVHFHLFDVQLINRVGWDGAIRPPDSNELGWKETVRMNPLEDAIVALKATKMALPFNLDDSVRPLDTTSALGTTGQFTNIDPLTNNPITVTNVDTNFGWEYVWHCHLLGHEENDMMRPIVFVVPKPNAPTNLTATANSATQVRLNWAYVNAAAPNDATSFSVQRATGAGAFTTITTGLAVTATSYTDNTASPGATYNYKVVAVGPSASASSNVATVSMPIAAPSNLKASLVGTGYAILTWSASNPSTGVTGYALYRSTNNGASWNLLVTTAPTTLLYRNMGLAANTTYLYRLQAVGAGGLTSGWSNTVTVVGK